MAARPPSLQDLYRRRAKKPFKFPKFTPVQGPVVKEQFGFIAERDGQILPGPVILSTENGDIIYGEKIALAD
jgi:hypothetical protein